MMVCPQKLLISHRLPVLSGSNPEVAYVTTQGVPLPPPPHTHTHPGKKDQEKKKRKKKEGAHPPPPPPHQKKKKKKRPKRPGEKKKRELSLQILPRRTHLLTSLHREKARKPWPILFFTFLFEMITHWNNNILIFESPFELQKRSWKCAKG